MKKIWDVVAITCADHAAAQAYRKELELRQKKCLLHNDTIVVCCVDPCQKIGSGGATLNALLQVSEHLSALHKYRVVTTDILVGKRILILHMGAGSAFSACTPGFLPLPANIENTTADGDSFVSLLTQFDALLLISLNGIAENSPPGFWICSADKAVILPSAVNINWSDHANIHLFTSPMHIEKACDSGVVQIGQDGMVEDIIYQGSSSALSHLMDSSECVPVVVGWVHLDMTVAATLVGLQMKPPFDACNYMGVDAGGSVEGANALKFGLSLFFDLLLPMAGNLTRSELVNGARSGWHGTNERMPLTQLELCYWEQAKSILWEDLHNYHMQAIHLDGSSFHFISNDPSDTADFIFHCPYERVESLLAPQDIKFHSLSTSTLTSVEMNGSSVVVNSILEDCCIPDNCTIINSHLRSSHRGDKSFLGSGSMLLNIQPEDLDCVLSEGLSLPANLLLTSVFIRNMPVSDDPSRIFIACGTNDKLHRYQRLTSNTVFNESWTAFFKRTGIVPTEVWPADIKNVDRNLLNARLFPFFHPTEVIDLLMLLWLQGSYSRNLVKLWRSSWRLSISEVMQLTCPDKEFEWRRYLHYSIGAAKARKVLIEGIDTSLLPFFRTCVFDGFFENILELLDDVARTCDSPSVMARSLACIADVLAIKANGHGGLRSGPSANQHWQDAFKFIKSGHMSSGVAALSKQRGKWLSSPGLLIRAARHYEGAFQLLVQQAVATARTFLNVQQSSDLTAAPIEVWVKGSAPGRIDIAGTWSDTPPICYQHGGRVVDIAIQIDGVKPIGCRVKRITELKIVLVMGSPECENPITIECHDMKDMLSYVNPNAPAALLKACFFCAELLTADGSLAAQLSTRYSSGFHLQTWADVPHGSGLGTSSILAGVVLACLWRVAGYRYTTESVLHAVLDLEQMLTTGGGWQDQVGGIMPSVKVGSSAQGLPLHLTSTPIDMPDGFLDVLERHLVVVFTGKTRLAKNMLQDVLRHWNSRSPTIVRTVNELISNADKVIEACRQGDLEGVGRGLSENWRHKKLIADGCEPAVCREIMSKLDHLVHGQCLAGAGGGGFLALISKEPDAAKLIEHELSLLESAKGATVHSVKIDQDGLLVWLDSEDDDK